MARRRLHRKQGGWSWLDVAGLAVDAYGAYNANQAANTAARQSNTASVAQDRNLEAQTQLALANEGRAEEMFDNYMDTALPANERVLRTAMQPINPNTEAAQAGADFALQDKVRGDTLHRNLSRRGVDPSSGAAIEAERVGLLDSTAGKAAAMSASRRGAKDRYIARVGNASQLFSPLIGQAGNFSAQANNGLASAGSALGSKATSAATAAGDASAAAGASLSDLFQDFSKFWKGRGASTGAEVDGK